MCSIAGFAADFRDEKLIEEMNNTLSHRGDDDSGIYISEDKSKGFVHLSHNRLSILDISKDASQPFVSKCKNYVIVYNGEIYNFKEIRRELVKRGYKFVSNGDTEVLLYAYKEWGREALDRFIGMFAFCIFDRVKNILFLARDRAGVKPLYFFYDRGEFVFASEIKGILKYKNFKKAINRDVVPFYLRFGYIPSPFSIFEKLYKLPPSSFMIYNLEQKSYEISKYWDIFAFYKAKKFKEDEEKILKNLENLLIESIEYRMVSDVGVGVFLSGGYDSSTVAAILQSNRRERINTFSIGFQEKEYDESFFAREIARYLKTDHHEHVISKKELIDIALSLPFVYDEPFSDDSTIPTIALSKFTKKSVKVALSGDGGDEIFCGYSKYKALLAFSSVFSSNLKKEGLSFLSDKVSISFIKRVNSFLPERFRNRNIEDKFIKFKRALNSKNLTQMFINASSNADDSEIKKILNFEYDKDLVLEKSAFSRAKEIEDLDFLDFMMAIDYVTYLTDNSLVKVDRASMSVSLEAREPLIDHRLAEFMARVPVGLKYKNGEKKYLLKKIVYKYIPKEMLNRAKSGFTPPLLGWLRDDLNFLIDIYLSDTLLKDISIFNIEEVKKLKKALKNRERVNVNLLWSVVVFAMWYDRWIRK